MSQEQTERMETESGFDVLNVSGVQTTVYRNEAEMEDTASSSVKLVGEIVPESEVSSLGLSPQEPMTADSFQNVTGAHMAATRNVSDTDQRYTAHGSGGVHAFDPAASGSHAPPPDVSHQTETVASRYSRPRSPVPRPLSPISANRELRARMARIRQTKLVRYVPLLDVPAPANVPYDMVSRKEADAALAKLHQAIGDATQRADQLVQAVADTRDRAEAAGQVAAAGAAGVAQTNAGLEQMVLELREELQTMRTKITSAEERASTAQQMADSAEKRADAAQRAADAAEQRAVTAQGNADAAQHKQA